MSDLGEMVVETSEIAPGLVIDRRLRLPGIRKMEQRYGLKFHQFDHLIEKMESLDDMIHAVLILAQQHDPSVTQEKVEDALGRLQLPDLIEHLKNAMVDMLTVQSKNRVALAESATAAL